MVRERGLEPPHLAALAPHASVYTIPPLARGVSDLKRLPYLRAYGKSKPVIFIRLLLMFIDNIHKKSLNSFPNRNFSAIMNQLFGQLAQLVRAPRLHRGGQRFESFIAHQ